jgi:hypothetical protein
MKITLHWKGTSSACRQSSKSTGKISTIEMGINPITKNRDDKQPQIKCIQVNVQHCKAATANLIKIIEESKTRIIYIQEPYTFKRKVAGILKKYKTFTSSE